MLISVILHIDVSHNILSVMSEKSQSNQRPCEEPEEAEILRLAYCLGVKLISCITGILRLPEVKRGHKVATNVNGFDGSDRGKWENPNTDLRLFPWTGENIIIIMSMIVCSHARGHKSLNLTAVLWA